MARSLRVLHVEDSEQDAALLGRHLSRAGYELVSARVEGPAAMRAALETQQWDVILCDYSMPDFNALQALDLMKEMGLDLPFIIISGTVGELVAVEAMRSGADDYLTKDNLVRLVPTIERELHEVENHRARLRAEERLRESEDRYRDLVEHSQELICTHDLNGQLLSVNPWAARVLGYTQDDLLKKNMRDFLAPELKDQFDYYLAALRLKGSTQGSMVVQTATGERRIWEYNNSLRTEGVDVPIVRGMAHDITERKQAEEKLALRERQLAEAQHLANLASWNWDLRNNTVTWSDEHYHIFGLDPRDHDPSHEATVTEHVHPEDLDRVKSSMEESLKSQQPFDFYYRIIHSDGDVRILHSRGDVVSDAKGIPIRMFGTAQDVTERKDAEEEQARLNAQLENQRQRLNSIVATVPGLVWEAWGRPDSASQRIDFVSNYIETMLGYSVAEWLSTPNFWLSIVHPDDKERAVHEAGEAFVNRSNCTTEFRWIAKDGHAVWVESKFIVITDPEGMPAGLRGVTTDITERKRAEAMQSRRAAQMALRGDISQALAQSNSSLPRILELCTEAIVRHFDAAFARIWTLNKEDNVLELQASAGMYTHIDGPHARVPVGSFKIGLIAEERRPHITNEVQADPRVGDKEWAAREGMISFAGYPLIAGDRLVGVMAMFARQKLADDTLDALASVADFISQGIERKRAEIELGETAERYRLLFESNPHPMWVYDLETLYFLAINEAATQHYGYSSEEFLSMTIKDIRPREDVPALLKNLSQGIGVIHESRIWRHRKKDGTIIDVEITSHEFLFDGKAAELILANDVTERRKLEVQLRQAQKLESMGNLAAGIAHEINTPTQYVGDNLRFIKEAYQSSIEVMKKYGELFAAARLGAVSAGLLDEISRALDESDLEYVSVEVPNAITQSLEGLARIAKIVQSMKDFAHPDSTEKKAADLNRAIESTINIARGEWKYVAEVETEFDVSLPPVPCLLGELNQVFLNMIINASHAIAEKMKREGEGKGLIRISTSHEGDWAVIRISDTGEGIALGNRVRVFDPFFTTKEVGKGTGQGLAISHAVVKKHGGTITFETAEGEGTTFIIQLPLQEAQTPDGLKEAA